ncbi:MAG: complex I subunit 4 family protein [Parachlamydiaceae bacterium]
MSNLSLLILTPFISSFVSLFSAITPLSARAKKGLAFILSLLPLALLTFEFSSWSGQKLDHPWISTLGIHFHLAIDGISLLFLLLTAIVTPLSILVIRSDTFNATTFYSLILLLQAFLLIFFTAHDLALFTVAWEAILLPIYFIILLWGGSKCHSAALQFLIYMIAGSALFVAAVLALYFSATESTFNLTALAVTAANAPHAPYILAVFLLAFAVKTPLFPFHGWLPETYTQAPFAGTILLAALLSKAGIYGMARIAYGLFPTLMSQYSFPLLILAIIGTLYAALAAWTQTDYKRLIAYSSLSHVNFILAGLFIASQLGLEGALLQAFNHGITIAALFLVAYWLKERTQTTTIDSIGGLNQFLPRLCWFTLFFVLASVALPSTNNFVGELIIFFALFEKYRWLTAILAFSIILSAIYMLRWMRKVYFEEPKETAPTFTDLTIKEIIPALALTVLILAVGIYPKPFLTMIQPAILHLTQTTGA